MVTRATWRVRSESRSSSGSRRPGGTLGRVGRAAAQRPGDRVTPHSDERFLPVRCSPVAGANESGSASCRGGGRETSTTREAMLYTGRLADLGAANSTDSAVTAPPRIGVPADPAADRRCPYCWHRLCLPSPVRGRPGRGILRSSGSDRETVGGAGLPTSTRDGGAHRWESRGPRRLIDRGGPVAIQDSTSSTGPTPGAADPRRTMRAPFPARAERGSGAPTDQGGYLQRSSQLDRDDLTSGRLLAGDPRTVARCPACGESVFAGEDYVRDRGELYHARCARYDGDGDDRSWRRSPSH